MQRGRAADGDARQRDLARDAERIEQGGDVVGHRVDVQGAAHLLRHAGAAGVVAQHAARREPRHDLVPAFHRAAHLVHEHQRAVAGAGQFVAEPRAVDFDEIHPTRSGFVLIFLFVTASDCRSASRSGVNDTGDDMDFKFMGRGGSEVRCTALTDRKETATSG